MKLIALTYTGRIKSLHTENHIFNHFQHVPPMKPPEGFLGCQESIFQIFNDLTIRALWLPEKLYCETAVGYDGESYFSPCLLSC